MPGDLPSRRHLLGGGGWLVAVAALTGILLTRQTDNAYLHVAVLVLLGPVGAAYLLAAALAGRPRLWAWRVAVGLLWVVGSPGLAVLAGALAIIPTQGYRTPAPFLVYLAAFVLLAATCYALGLRPLRR